MKPKVIGELSVVEQWVNSMLFTAILSYQATGQFTNADDPSTNGEGLSIKEHSHVTSVLSVYCSCITCMIYRMRSSGMSCNGQVSYLA